MKDIFNTVYATEDEMDAQKKALISELIKIPVEGEIYDADVIYNDNGQLGVGDYLIRQWSRSNGNLAGFNDDEGIKINRGSIKSALRDIEGDFWKEAFKEIRRAWLKIIDDRQLMKSVNLLYKKYPSLNNAQYAFSKISSIVDKLDINDPYTICDKSKNYNNLTKEAVKLISTLSKYVDDICKSKIMRNVSRKFNWEFVNRNFDIAIGREKQSENEYEDDYPRDDANLDDVFWIGREKSDRFARTGRYNIVIDAYKRFFEFYALTMRYSKENAAAIFYGLGIIKEEKPIQYTRADKDAEIDQKAWDIVQKELKADNRDPSDRRTAEEIAKDVAWNTYSALNRKFSTLRPEEVDGKTAEEAAYDAENPTDDGEEPPQDAPISSFFGKTREDWEAFYEQNNHKDFEEFIEKAKKRIQELRRPGGAHKLAYPIPDKKLFSDIKQRKNYISIAYQKVNEEFSGLFVQHEKYHSFLTNINSLIDRLYDIVINDYIPDDNNVADSLISIYNYSVNDISSMEIKNVSDFLPKTDDEWKKIITNKFAYEHGQNQLHLKAPVDFDPTKDERLQRHLKYLQPIRDEEIQKTETFAKDFNEFLNEIKTYIYVGIQIYNERFNLATETYNDKFLTTGLNEDFNPRIMDYINSTYNDSIFRLLKKREFSGNLSKEDEDELNRLSDEKEKKYQELIDKSELVNRDDIRYDYVYYWELRALEDFEYQHNLAQSQQEQNEAKKRFNAAKARLLAEPEEEGQDFWGAIDDYIDNNEFFRNLNPEDIKTQIKDIDDDIKDTEKALSLLRPGVGLGNYRPNSSYSKSILFGKIYLLKKLIQGNLAKIKKIKTGKESESGDKDIDVSNLSKKLQMWLLGQEKLDPRIEKFLIDETTEKTQHIAAQQDAKKNLERRLSTVNTFYRVPDIIVLGKNTWKTIVANMKKHARGVLVNYINHNYERKEMSAG